MRLKRDKNGSLNATPRSLTVSSWQGGPRNRGQVNARDVYTYDKVNRVGSAAEGAVWTENYGYDNLANRWLASYSGLPTPTLETPVAQSWYLNNRINGWGYDASGNVTQVGTMQRSFSYDAENRQVTGTINGQTANYSYDGGGARGSRLVNGVTTVYAYDAMGQMAAEDGSTPPAAPPCVTGYLTAEH